MSTEQRATAKEYWETCFAGRDPDSYDYTRSGPSPCLVDFCDRFLGNGGAVLDLGCGSGRSAHYLARRGCRVSGIDLAAGAVDFCRRRFAKFGLAGTFQTGRFDHIPFPDDSFGAVVCIAALDHVAFETARTALGEIRRVLAPAGAMLLTFDPPDTDEDRLHEAEVLTDGTLVFIKGDQKGMVFRRYQDAEIRKLLGDGKIISFTQTDDGARIIVSR